MFGTHVDFVLKCTESLVSVIWLSREPQHVSCEETGFKNGFYMSRKQHQRSLKPEESLIFDLLDDRLTMF